MSREDKQREKDYQHEYYLKNKDRLMKYKKEYRKKHYVPKQRKSKKKKDDFTINSEKCKRYYYKNKEKINSQRAVYQQNRRNTEPIFAMKYRVRNLIGNAVRRKSKIKTIKTNNIVGCSLDELCEHLFATWEKNYGTKWNGEPYHIDHIVPLATAKTEEDVIRLCHYTNLQMLTPEDNMKKSDKTIDFSSHLW